MAVPPIAASRDKRYRILIIEDDANIAKLIRFNLIQKGLECRYAGDGAAGIAEFLASKPDLILLDMMLPRMSGHDVCAKIRETSTVPIILMTAANSEEAEMAAFRSGADDFISKPFDITLLIARVMVHLRRVYRYDDMNKPSDEQKLGPGAS